MTKIIKNADSTQEISSTEGINNVTQQIITDHIVIHTIKLAVFLSLGFVATTLILLAPDMLNAAKFDIQRWSSHANLQLVLSLLTRGDISDGEMWG